MVLRHAVRLVGDLFRYGADSGRWWVPVLTVVFAVAVVLALTAKAVVAPALYVFF